ncbi:hypothetical protein WMF30_11450 [Sorangium sp. So ce134]
MKAKAFLVASFAVGFIAASASYSSAFTKIRRYSKHTCEAVLSSTMEGQAAGHIDGWVCPHVTSEDFTATEAHEVQVVTFWGTPGAISTRRPFAKVCSQFTTAPDSSSISCSSSNSVEAGATQNTTQQLDFRWDLLDENQLEPWHDNPTAFPYVYYSTYYTNGSALTGVKVLKD